MEHEQTPALEAGDEDVQAGVEAIETAEDDEAPEAAENTEGQVKTPPAEDGDDEPSEEMSKAKQRRERRKAAMERDKQELAEARERAERAEAELARRRGDKDKPPPKQEDFDNYDDYLAERAAHAARRGIAEEDVARLEREQEHHKKQFEAAQARRVEVARRNWADQVGEARERYADFEEVVMKPEKLPMSQRMQGAVMEHERAADLAYYFATHPDLALRISALEDQHPALVAAAVQTAAEMLPEAGVKPRIETAAPEPVNAVKGKSAGANLDPAKMTMAEYRAYRQAGGT